MRAATWNNPRFLHSFGTGQPSAGLSSTGHSPTEMAGADIVDTYYTASIRPGPLPPSAGRTDRQLALT
jgi:hypothetical protein